MITGIGDIGESGTHHIGILFGLGAAVLYASVVLMNKFIKNVEGIHRTFIQFLAVIGTLVPYVAATGGVTLETMTGKGWICLLVVGFIHTGVTYCLYFTALKEMPGQKAAILSYVDPLVAVVVSVVILGEQLTLLQAVGGVLILGFTLWNELSTGETTKTKKGEGK
jgi:drug/metabolite transporter (DMT)-like permease